MTTAERRTDDPAAVLDSVPLGAFVGGTWTDTGRTFPVEDPATGEVLAAVADCGPDEARAALDAAAAARPALAATAPRERAELLRRIHELLLRDRERLATIITLEMGKPVAESRGEVAYAAEFFRWFSEEACRIEGSYATSPDGRGRILVTRRPVGPCLLITPWNFPLAMGARKIAPALAAGCTSVVKPAEQTPLTMLALAALLEEAGVPAGAVSVLPASDPEAVADPVLADPRLRKLSFTGSTEVGRHLIRRSADQVLRVSLELGGNAPFLVFEDADLDAAVEGALVAKMRNGGEACTAANRFLVHDAVADEFARRLAERMAALVVGRGTEPGVDVGPLIDGPARDRVVGLIEEATAGGAQVRTGGAALPGAGYFLEPTVLTDVPAGAEMTRTEIFGPVAPIQRFDDTDAAVAAANDTPYGLVSYVYTRDIDRALAVCEALEAGMVGLNRGVVSDPAAPFGGVKQSGLGREGGRVGIDEFLETTYVALPR